MARRLLWLLGAVVTLLIGAMVVFAASHEAFRLPATVAFSGWALLAIGAVVRRRRLQTAAALVVIGATGLSLEGGLRVFNAVRPTFLFYSGSYERFRGQPGARIFDATFNSRGFNDVEHALERPAHVRRRVVAIGDSFAVGVVPQRDNYLTRLEAALSRDAVTEVINLGIAGTEPGQYLSILVTEGLAYRPDLVLVGLYIGNDLATPAPRWHERSFLASLVMSAWRLARAPTSLAGPSTATRYDDAAPGLDAAAFMRVETSRAWIYDRRSTRLAEATERVADLLVEMRSVARTRGADLTVTLIPAEMQVDGSLRRDVAEALGVPTASFDPDQPTRLLTMALSARGLDFVDLLPAFRAGAEGQRLYKPLDTHWNRAGNHLAADVVAEALASRFGRPR